VFYGLISTRVALKGLSILFLYYALSCYTFFVACNL